MPHSLGTFLAEQESTVPGRGRIQSIFDAKKDLLRNGSKSLFWRFVASGEEYPPEAMIIAKGTHFQGKTVETSWKYDLLFSAGVI
jgi:hypothetical protein